MLITVAELEKDLDKYLMLSAAEDIFITKNGKIISKLTDPFQDRVGLVESLIGILPADVSLEEAREERLGKI